VLEKECVGFRGSVLGEDLEGPPMKRLVGPRILTAEHLG
jgi:hypothetical protein